MGVLVNCLEGIGDSLYLRPLVKVLVEREGDVWLKTPLPEIFADLDVRFVAMQPRFRTQARNYAAATVAFEPDPHAAQVINPVYNLKEMMAWGITGALEHEFGFEVGKTPFKWDLPENLEPHGLSLPSRVAVIRPNSLRKEWLVPARNCKPEYLCEAVGVLREAGYYVISIGDYKQGVEWVEEPEPPADLKLHEGQLSIAQTLSLIQDADLTVGSHGFIAAASISAGTSFVSVFGGRGMYDCPEKVYDFRMPLHRVVDILPDEFCRCRQRLHQCNKTVSDFAAKFREALEKLEQ